MGPSFSFSQVKNSRLICNLINGSPITADNIDKVMKQLRERIIRLLANGEITNGEEREKLEYLLKQKNGIHTALVFCYPNPY